jgi:multiple sugar transport system ATP-binding protein
VTRANGSGRPGHQRLGVAVELVQPTGSRAYITFPLGGVPTVAELDSHDVQRPGEQIDLDLDMNRAVLIDPDSDRVI